MNSSDKDEKQTKRNTNHQFTDRFLAVFVPNENEKSDKKDPTEKNTPTPNPVFLKNAVYHSLTAFKRR